MTAAFSIRNGDAGDWDAVRTLLVEDGLPIADLDASSMERFMVAESSQGDVIGAIGIEQYEHVALLRSLVISVDERQGGVGRALVERLEALASSLGITEVWLLTLDADGYFRRLGYEVQERAAAPSAISGTEEFSNLCPGSAVLMRRHL